MTFAATFLLMCALGWLVGRILGAGPGRVSIALHRRLPFPVPRIPYPTADGLVRTVLWALFCIYTYGALKVLLILLLSDAREPLAGYAALGLTLFLSTRAPWWLVWRVLGPAGRVRAGRGVLIVAGPVRGYRRRGAVDLFTAVYGQGSRALEVERANPWLAVAAVVREERRRDLERMALFEEGIEKLPRNAPFPRSLRVVGGEALARLALLRGDWPAVARRARLGRGRGVLLMRLLARTHLGRPVPPFILWTAWLLSPGRRESRPWVRKAIQGVGKGEEATLPAAPSPWLEHLRLLSDAAAGRPVPVEAVARLAASWEEELTAARQAPWIARGLELGARSPSAACDELRREVLDGLQAMIGAGRGDWPETGGEGLAAELGRRCRDRLFDSIHRRVLPFQDGEPTRSFGPPMEEWGEWLALRRDVQRLAELCGPAAVATAWHGGLRLAACNWPVFLERRYGPRVMWATHVMHGWAARLARETSDDDIQRLCGRNLALARRDSA